MPLPWLLQVWGPQQLLSVLLELLCPGGQGDDLLDHLARLVDLHGHLVGGLGLCSYLGLGHSSVRKESLVSFKF